MASTIQIRQASDAKEFRSDDGLIGVRRVFGPSRGSERIAFEFGTAEVGLDVEGLHETRDEIIYVLTGKLEVEFDGACQTITPGSTVFIPQGLRYQLRVIDGPAEILGVFSPPD